MKTRILLSTLLTIALFAAASFAALPASAQGQPPQAPVLETGPAPEPDAVLLTWQPPSDVVSYRIWYGPAGLDPGHGQLWPVDDPAANSALIQPLLPHTTYAFHIMAKVQPAGEPQTRWSLWSPPASAAPASTPASTQTSTQASTQDRTQPSARADKPPSPVPDSICDRSYHLVNRIRLTLGSHDSCSTISAEQLAAITSLDLSQAPPSATDLLTRTETILWDEYHDRYQGPVSIPASDFAGLTSVTDLAIGGLNWEHLDPEIFRHMPNIQHLDASRNSIPRLFPHVFAHAPSLTRIHLEHNLIERIDDQAFDGLPNLEHLDLSHNSIYAMPSQAVSLSKHPSLATLSLAFNPGSDGPLSELPVLQQTNAQGKTIFACLVLDTDHRCIQPD